MNRYALKLDRYSSHQQVAAWLEEHKHEIAPDRLCTIYDIGCSQGFLGQLLTPESFHLYGLDVDLDAIKAAKKYYRAVSQADIEQLPLPEFPQRPDVLVLADVLEHTRYPDICLQNLLNTYLPQGGHVIISVPNIANIYIRWSLLWGHFNYTERGILDRTHFRFFTKRTFLKLFQSTGLKPELLMATPIPLPLVNKRFEEGQPLWFLHRLNALAARLLPTLFGYQLILYGYYPPPSRN